VRYRTDWQYADRAKRAAANACTYTIPLAALPLEQRRVAVLALDGVVLPTPEALCSLVPGQLDPRATIAVAQ